MASVLTPWCSLLASSCVVFRLAKSIQEVAEAAKPERESCLVRAGRIAAHYWDDPAKWAAQDPYGKGVLTCLRAVDADYPLGNVAMVHKAVNQHKKDMQANGLTPTELTSRRDRAAAAVLARRRAEVAENAGRSPQKAGNVRDEATGELQTGGTVSQLLELHGPKVRP